MDFQIKRNIFLTGIFMAAAAFVPGILFALSWSCTQIGNYLVYMIMPLYAMGCLFILIWGSCQVIWKLPYRKSLRFFLFFLWLGLYPVLCLGLLRMTLWALMALFR